MTLTPSMIRNDLKCGKGAISKGEKCTKGPATAVQPQPQNTIRNVALGVGAVAAIGGVAFGSRAFSRSLKAARKQGPEVNTPAGRAQKIKAVSKQGRAIALGAEIAGAGIGVAGAGLIANEYAKEPKKRQAGGIMAGGALLYLGANTALSGRVMRNAFNRQEAEWSFNNRNYETEWNRAREQAKQRESQNRASGNQGSRNVGANKAVKDPFKDLGISERTSDADIKKQWLKLMRENHPDVGGDPRKAQQINAAYQEIMRRRGKLDSIYADGFDIDWEAISL